MDDAERTLALAPSAYHCVWDFLTEATHELDHALEDNPADEAWNDLADKAVLVAMAVFHSEHGRWPAQWEIEARLGTLRPTAVPPSGGSDKWRAE